MSDQKLKVIPLGGLGEFGMNCMAIRYGDDIIVVDAGMMFPDAELLGVDIVTPDFAYLEENKEFVRALVLTHGHEDHIGGIPFLLSQLNIPIYGTAFTLALVERRLEEHEMLDEARLHRVKPGQKIELGPFHVEFVHVTHSIVSCVALAITTPLGVIIHTGDFKVDPTPTDNVLFDLHTLAEYGKRGVLLLLSDSTNVDRPGYTASERAVLPRFEEIFNRAERRVVVACFSSSIHRLQQILDLAATVGRKVAFIGRSMLSATEIAHNLGLLTIPDNLLLRPQDIMSVAPHKVVCVVSGTQGEPMSAMSRVAVDNHKSLSLERGDVVVHSARIIPGNEKAIGRMMNHIARRGAEVVAGSMNPPIHVSGHGSQEELKLLLNLIRPRYFVPIHGEYWQMSKHAALASHLRSYGLEDTFILETGQTLEIDRHGARKGEKVTVGRICIDSGSIDEIVEDMVIRDRRHLSEDGFVIPIIAIDKHTGKCEGLPEIVSRGFVSMEERSELMASARQVVLRTLETSSNEERTDWGVMQEKIRADLKRFLNKQTQRRPLIMPVILEV
ncbi:ribonuclease J [Paludibaculum fermentans]|uniref:Ribonuclease J n=1 Tax=Paludibaculum fermentans TaxID=1473598 RepID=A0A7S7NSR6_PALFE|nr:ribonuclease J [Paludibaculum fermentans]QOY89044.1 ribonuclease J [Paludibaculum fermentans]